MRRTKKIRVLVVDDSALVRQILRDGLEEDPDIEVIGAADDPYRAREYIVRDTPDVITLDVEMPKMDGVTFLRRYLPRYPIPTIMVSSLTKHGAEITLEALEAGAVDIVAKPSQGVVDALPAMMGELRAKVHAAATANMRHFSRARSSAPPKPLGSKSRALSSSTDQVIVIGSSTGGTEALARILPAFPAGTPGVVVVQHMPPGFTASLAQRLDRISAMEVREASGGERVRSGLVLIAPGGERHISVERSGGQYRVLLNEGEKVSSHRPSVDVLFRSVARDVGPHAVAALLTGMGKDGAAGMEEIRRAGGHTLAQDEASSVVWGMPQEAWKRGGAEALVALDDMPEAIVSALARDA